MPYDVNSLFTNVKVDEVFHELCEQPSMIEGFPPNRLERALIHVRLRCTNLLHVDQAVIGRSLGSILANIFVGTIESKMKPELLHLTLYYRYIDDTVLVIPTFNAVKTLM